MFGSNELIGESRTSQISGGIYDFVGKWVSNETNDDTAKAKRYIYFKECVHDPIMRYDFRGFKTEVYNNINKDVLDIPKCLARFNTEILFNTTSEVGAGFSKRLTSLNDATVTGTGDTKASFDYVSVIAGADDKNDNDKNNKTKFSNIQPLNRGNNGDNASENTYSALMKKTNEDTTKNRAMKEREIEIYGKVYGFRQRINEIFGMMRTQAKDDSANINSVRITESVVEELRKMLAYLAVIQRTDAVVRFEQKNGYYNTTKTAVTGGTNQLAPLSPTVDIGTMTDRNNIFRIPLLDDTYNTNDEKRYVYGITFYFDTISM